MRIADALLDEDGRILPEAWADAEATELPVGTCHCGGPALAVGTTSGHPLAGGRTFYEIRCLFDDEHEATVPAGRVLRSFLRPVQGLDETLLEAARERDLAILGERRDG